MISVKSRSAHFTKILAIVLCIIFVVSLFVGCSEYETNRSLRLVRKAAIAEIKGHYNQVNSTSVLVKGSINISSVDVVDSGNLCFVYGTLSVTDKYGDPKPDVKFKIECKLIDGKWTISNANYYKR